MRTTEQLLEALVAEVEHALEGANEHVYGSMVIDRDNVVRLLALVDETKRPDIQVTGVSEWSTDFKCLACGEEFTVQDEDRPFHKHVCKVPE